MLDSEHSTRGNASMNFDMDGEYLDMELYIKAMGTAGLGIWGQGNSR